MQNMTESSEESLWKHHENSITSLFLTGLFACTHFQHITRLQMNFAPNSGIISAVIVRFNIKKLHFVIILLQKLQRNVSCVVVSWKWHAWAVFVSCKYTNYITWVFGSNFTESLFSISVWTKSNTNCRAQCWMHTAQLHKTRSLLLWSYTGKSLSQHAVLL